MPPAPGLRLVETDDSGASAAPTSLAELFRQYARHVGSIGLRHLGRLHEVDDFVQDVFLAAHRGVQQVRQPAAAQAWLKAIAVRLAFRRLRRRRLWSVLGLEEEYDYTLVADPALSPEDRAALREVYRKLDALPAGQRLAW